MKTFELVGTPRSEYGKKAAKAFRKENLVPCNLYARLLLYMMLDLVPFSRLLSLFFR